MSILETLQTKTREDATKEVFALLNSKAMDILSNMSEELIDEGYHKVYTSDEKRAMVKKSNANWMNSKDFGNEGSKTSTKLAFAMGYHGTSDDKMTDEQKKAKANLSQAAKDSWEEDKKKGASAKNEEVEISEGVRKVGEYSAGRHKATIHKDSDLGEFKVKFHTDGKHLPDADYFCPDKEDAEGTAKLQIDQLHSKD